MSIVILLVLNLLTFLFTLIMAIAGVGAAFIIIPMLNYAGIDILVAMTIGLLMNTISTGTASIRHHQVGVIEYHIAFPIILSSLIFTPLGAYLSGIIDRWLLKLFFTVFLVLAGSNITLKTIKTMREPSLEDQLNRKTQNHAMNTSTLTVTQSKSVNTRISTTTRILVSTIIGAIIGFLAGLIGVGGGSMVLPVLLYLGLETKKAAGTTSFIVVFSSFIGFISKIIVGGVQLEWSLTLTMLISTIIAAGTGSYLMHYKLNKNQIKLTIGIMLLLVSVKLLSDLM